MKNNLKNTKVTPTRELAEAIEEELNEDEPNKATARELVDENTTEHDGGRGTADDKESK